MYMCTVFEGGGGSVKVYILYTCENVYNYGWPLSLEYKIQLVHVAWILQALCLEYKIQLVHVACILQAK